MCQFDFTVWSYYNKCKTIHLSWIFFRSENNVLLWNWNVPLHLNVGCWKKQNVKSNIVALEFINTSPETFLSLTRPQFYWKCIVFKRLTKENTVVVVWISVYLLICHHLSTSCMIGVLLLICSFFLLWF